MTHRTMSERSTSELCPVPIQEQDVVLWYDGSLDQSFIVDPLSYFSFQTGVTKTGYVLSCLWDGA